MERLTKRVGQHVYYIGFDCNNPGSGDIPAEMDAGEVRKVLHRLAAYEDTGLEPEEVKDLQLEVATLKTIEKMYDGLGRPDHLRELAQAAKDGRLVVLPCKVGDKVWVIMENREIHSFVVRGISMSATCTDTVLRFSDSFLWGSNIGKTWFMTRQEAEEAVKEEADNG